MKVKDWLDSLIIKAKNHEDVVGIIQYGSSIYSSTYKDIDIALFLSPKTSPDQQFKIQIFFLKELPDFFDVKIFNLLPVALQHEVLKGKVHYSTESMYKLAYNSIKEYEDFIKYRTQYLEEFLGDH